MVDASHLRVRGDELIGELRDCCVHSRSIAEGVGEGKRRGNVAFCGEVVASLAQLEPVPKPRFSFVANFVAKLKLELDRFDKVYDKVCD